MPKWKELKRFCDKDGWELYKDTDHYFYQKIMPLATAAGLFLLFKRLSGNERK